MLTSHITNLGAKCPDYYYRAEDIFVALHAFLERILLMKTRIKVMMLFFVWLVMSPMRVQGETAFFRVVSSSNTVIIAFNANGAILWSNDVVGVTCTVQSASSMTSTSNWVDYISYVVTGKVMSARVRDPNPPPGMVFIPAGLNYGTDPDFGPYSLTVSAFYMDKYLVTKAKWDEVYNWAIANGYSFTNAGSGKVPNHPVHTVNWYDCVKWCNARSEKEGQIPAYFTDSSKSTVYKSGQIDIENNCVNWSSGYRLPTDTEWEYAARGGLSGKRFPWGDTIQHARANYFSFSDDINDTSPTRGFHPTYSTGGEPYTSPVGSFAANGYGLYDMSGNCWEWCWGWYPGNEFSNRLFRGGSWGFTPSCCRVGERNFGGSAAVDIGLGFRVALSLGP